MRAAIFCAVAAVIAFLCATPVVAQSTNRTLFRQYLASTAHQDLVDAALKELPPEVFTRCAAFRPSEPDLAVLQPLGFGADGAPNAGAWSESFPVRGCGNDTILHVNFAMGDGGKLIAFASLPGTTHANLTLQRDAVPYAATGARLRVKNCERVFVTNTRFDALDPIVPPTVDTKAALDPKAKPPLPPLAPTPAKARAWREIWNVFACGRRFEVPMHFIPDATGTQIVQKTEEIKEL